MASLLARGQPYWNLAQDDCGFAVAQVSLQRRLVSGAIKKHGVLQIVPRREIRKYFQRTRFNTFLLRLAGHGLPRAHVGAYDLLQL